jgi:hypothetical protein
MDSRMIIEILNLKKGWVVQSRSIRLTRSVQASNEKGAGDDIAP